MSNRNGTNGNGISGDALDLGIKLRSIRSRLGLSVREAAQLASLSPSMLSKVERGLAQLSLSALIRLSKAYGVKVGDLIDTGDGSVRAFRARERVARTTLRGGTQVAWILSGASTALQVDILYISPGGESGEPYLHEGEEIAYVIKGRIELMVDGEPYLLEAGDLLYYPSTKPHGWRNPSDSTAEILWVTAKGRF